MKTLPSALGEGRRLTLRSLAGGLCAIAIVMSENAIARNLPGVVSCDNFYDAAVIGKDIWVVGFPGIILHSPDSGRTFEQQGDFSGAAVFAVDFVDSQTGFAVGRKGLVLATRDGGKRFVIQNSGTEEPLLALDAVDRDHVFAVGNFATAIRTSDGGNTWSSMEVIGAQEDSEAGGADPSFNAVAFVDTMKGYIAGEFGLIYRTLDGGNTWTQLDSGINENLFGMAVLPGDVIAAVGSNGALVVSSDGEHFSYVATGTEKHLFRVSAGAGRIFITGDAGLVLTATSPEGPYTPWTAPTYFWLGPVKVSNDGNGILVGARAFIMITSDGGRTFKQWGGQ